VGTVVGRGGGARRERQGGEEKGRADAHSTALGGVRARAREAAGGPAG